MDLSLRLAWRVKARFPGEGDALFDGTVEGLYLTGDRKLKVKVAYDDGDVEESLPSEDVVEVMEQTQGSVKQEYGIGEAVECVWGDEHEYYLGIVTQAEVVGSAVVYRVQFEDGDERSDVPAEDLRPVTATQADTQEEDQERMNDQGSPMADTTAEEESLGAAEDAKEEAGDGCEQAAAMKEELEEEGEGTSQDGSRGTQGDAGGTGDAAVGPVDAPGASEEERGEAWATCRAMEKEEGGTEPQASGALDQAAQVPTSPARVQGGEAGGDTSGSATPKPQGQPLPATITEGPCTGDTTCSLPTPSPQAVISVARLKNNQQDVRAHPSHAKPVAPGQSRDGGGVGGRQETLGAKTSTTQGRTASASQPEQTPSPHKRQASPKRALAERLPCSADSYWAYVHSLEEPFGDGSKRDLPEGTSALPEDRFTYIQWLTARGLQARAEAENRGEGLEAQLLASQGLPVGFYEEQQASHPPLTGLDQRLIDLHTRILALTRLCFGTQSAQSVRAMCDLADIYASHRLWPQAESALGRAQYLHLQLARKAAAQDAAEGLADHDNAPQLQEWEVPGMSSPSRRGGRTRGRQASPSREEAGHPRLPQWRYKKVDMDPASAARGVLSVLATLRSMASASNDGSVDVQSFIARLRAGRAHMTKEYAERFARELEKPLGADRVLFPGSPQRQQQWQALIDVLRCSHGLFQHSVRAAHYAIDMQDVVVLRLVFEAVERQKCGVVDPEDLASELKRETLAMQAFPKELGLIDAIHSYTSLPPSGSGAKGEGMTGSRKPVALPLCWEEVLALLVTRPRPAPLMAGRLATQGGRLTPGKEALNKALEEVEMHNQATSLSATPLYWALADYWMARAILESEVAAESTQAQQSSPERGGSKNNTTGREKVVQVTSMAAGTGKESGACLERAKEYMTRALEVTAAAYDWTHPEVARGSIRLAGLLLRMGEDHEAGLWLVRALEIFQSFYSDKHYEGPLPAISVVSILLGRGLVHHEVASQRLSGCELIAQALELMVKRMYKMPMSDMGEDETGPCSRKKALAVYIFRTGQQLAGHWLRIGEPNKSVRALKLSIKAGKEAYGRDSVKLAEVLKRLGLVYESNRQNLDSAFECYRRVRELYMKHLGHMDSRTREAMGLLRRCMAKREALGLPRVPVAWDFVHHTQAPDGQHRIQAREQKGQDLEDMEERLDGQENQGIVGAVLNEFVLKEVAT